MSTFIASLPTILVCLLVCASKILEISIQSLKTVMMVKGQKSKAAMLGFIECVIWGLVVSSVITTLGDNIALLLFYCLGYALGLYIGSSIESKIALGTSNIQLIANEKNTKKIIDYLQENNKGYTIFEGNGAKEKVNMILIVMQRKESKKLMKEIKALCNNEVFEITTDINGFHGGHGI